MRIRKLGAVPSVAAAVLLSAVLAAGCAAPTGTASESSSTRPELTGITVAASPSTDLAGLYIAQEEGLFAQQGLHVTLEKIASNQAAIAAQLKGQVDISAQSYVSYIAAQAAGARFRILAEASTLKPGTRVLVTRTASRITSIAGLAGQKIGVNGTNNIGTLLVSALLQEYGVSPKKVDFITDPKGYTDMPGQLQVGSWGAALLAEPYATIGGEDYGDKEVADTDQGATENFPMDGYVATQAWAEKYPKTAAAFVRAIQAGQTIADTSHLVVQGAIAKYDDLPIKVTAVMALPGFPTGSVQVQNIQRVADVMLEFGALSPRYSAEVQNGALIRSMVS
jgi:NitT/TauT family transport system substrate-binding protein